MARAVANARLRETRWGIAIRKDHPASPRKIDVAIAAILAHERATAPRPARVESIYERRGILTLAG
ncbi:MAG: hypothetical protein H0X16_02720 [Chloroflexi bacterium]|nr:hypothetical protein [Chloroflexota bacterium]